MPMPKLPVDVLLAACNACDEYLVTACFTGARLRARKPCQRPTTIFEASVNYVWRHLCFHCVDSPPHSCMPVMASYDIYRVVRGLPDARAAARANIDSLDGLIKKLLHTLPLEYQAGTCRWGRALGFKV